MGQGSSRNDRFEAAEPGDWFGDGIVEFDDLIRPERWARLFRGTTVAGLLFGIVGPYGSFLAKPTSRLFYWTMLFWAGTLILWPAVVSGLRIGVRRGFPPWFTGAVAVLLASIPLAGVAAAGCYMFWPVHASGIRPIEWYVQTVVIAMPAVTVALWFEAGRPQLPQMASGLGFSPPRGRQATSLPIRGGALPLHLVEAALCLQMEDHHVRVHTVGRSYLHLVPLRQVAEELGPERGLQVHRSWWVARTAVSTWEEQGRSIVLTLTNGMRVPVARNRVAVLRASGWLDRPQSCN
jgi:hypothetical protein